MRKDSVNSRSEELPEGMIEGRNAVTEAIRSGRTINKVFLADGDTDKALGRLAAMAKEAGAVVVRIDRRNDKRAEADDNAIPRHLNDAVCREQREKFSV